MLEHPGVVKKVPAINPDPSAEPRWKDRRQVSASDISSDVPCCVDLPGHSGQRMCTRRDRLLNHPDPFAQSRWLGANQQCRHSSHRSLGGRHYGFALASGVPAALQVFPSTPSESMNSELINLNDLTFKDDESMQHHAPDLAIASARCLLSIPLRQSCTWHSADGPRVPQHYGRAGLQLKALLWKFHQAMPNFFRPPFSKIPLSVLLI